MKRMINKKSIKQSIYIQLNCLLNLNVFHEIRATMWQLMDNKDRFSCLTSCSYTQDVAGSNPASPTLRP